MAAGRDKFVGRRGPCRAAAGGGGAGVGRLVAETGSYATKVGCLATKVALLPTFCRRPPDTPPKMINFATPRGAGTSIRRNGPATVEHNPTNISYMTNNRLITLILTLVMAATLLAQERAKYVFYFIGDGMGVNQVNGAETYLGALEGRIGISPLTFASFPHVGLVNTQSATNGVTDSAASGTALATGHKTKNSALGLAADLTTPLQSIAFKAREAGAAVGVTTNVSVDHATPAAFYAHVPKRGMYHQIGRDLIAAGFDFYAGSDFRQPEDAADSLGSLFKQCADAGYTIVRGYKEYKKKRRNAGRMILLQSEKPSNGDRTCLPYAMDRRPGELTLADITRAGLSFLSARQDSCKGFFLMVEGGKVDYACHANDAAPAFKEVIDLDNAIRVAYEFYEQHPEETLIVVTADHETGGLVLGRGAYELHTEALRHQKMSAEEYSRHLRRLCAKAGKKLSWQLVENDLRENWGFWQHVKLNDHQTKRLQKAYDALAAGQDNDAKSLYTSLNGLADAARRTMAECAHIGWQSGGHSNGYVPVFAIGAGAEKFGGRIDNTLIPQKIAEAAGW